MTRVYVKIGDMANVGGKLYVAKQVFGIFNCGRCVFLIRDGDKWVGCRSPLACETFERPDEKRVFFKEVRQ